MKDEAEDEWIMREEEKKMRGGRVKKKKKKRKKLWCRSVRTTAKSLDRSR